MARVMGSPSMTGMQETRQKYVFICECGEREWEAVALTAEAEGK